MAYEMEQNKVSSCDVNSLTCNLKSPRKSYSDVVKKCRQVKEVNGDGEKPASPQQYRVESPEAKMINVGPPTPPLVMEENLRFSLRNAHNMMERVEEKAMAAAKKRDIEGTTYRPNSFEALSNPDLILRAVKMGVNIPDNDFSNVDILRELEKCRNAENIKTNDEHHDLGGG